MKRYLPAAAAALGLTLIAACDFVRFPGDGGPPPETPGTDEPVLPQPPVDDTAPDTELPADPETPDETPDVPGDTETPPTDEAPDVPPVDTLDPEPQPEPEPEPQPEPEPPAPVEPVFSYHAPGSLIPGSGTGQTQQIVHAPNILFPIKSAPTYLQSQVFMPGGGVAGGSQCAASNYAYPWRDNFCEARTANRNSPFCPTSKIHQGQDIARRHSGRVQHGHPPAGRRSRHP